MTTLFSKAVRILRGEDLSSFLKKSIKWGYDTFLRQLLPTRVVLDNKIPVRASHVGDSVIPWHDTDIPGYEDTLIRGIRRFVETGDAVVVVGGGWGVSTVAAAR